MTFQVLSSHKKFLKFDKVGFSWPWPGLICQTPLSRDSRPFWKVAQLDFYWFFAISLWSETSKFKVTQSVRLFEKIPCLLGWNFMLRVIRIWRIQWLCSFFLCLTGYKQPFCWEIFFKTSSCFLKLKFRITSNM